MLIEVLLIIALPLLGTFVITLLRKVADGEPLDYEFGNDAGLEMIVLSLGGLAGAAHNPRLMANWGSETSTWLSFCFLADMGLAAGLLYLRKFETAQNRNEALRDGALGVLGVFILIAVLWMGRP